MKKHLYLLVALLVVLGIGCTKKLEDLNDSGQTVVLIFNAPEKKVVLEPFVDKKTIEVFELRRNVHNQSELNSAAKVKLRLNQTLIAEYNKENGSNFVELPGNVFTGAAGSSFNGAEMDVSFAPGEFAKAVAIVIDGAKFDLFNSYALGLSVADASGRTISGDKKDVVVTFNVKNKWDGEYDAIGYFYHPSVPREIDEPKTLATAGPNSVRVDLGDLGASGFVAIFTIDPVTNAVTIAAAPGAASAPYTMFTSGLPNSNPGYTGAWPGSSQCNNRYDPVTKSFYVRYGYVGATGWRVTEEIIKLK
jgi:Domain of unknown function (DUF1735)